jgi:hypothetical protein
MFGPTTTVPSDWNSISGIFLRKPLSVCWPRASTTASASSVSNWPVGRGPLSGPSSTTSTVSDGPMISLMLVSHLIFTHDRDERKARDVTNDPDHLDPVRRRHVMIEDETVDIAALTPAQGFGRRQERMRNRIAQAVHDLSLQIQAQAIVVHDHDVLQDRILPAATR